MYISPQSKNEINPKFYNNNEKDKNKDKENESKEKDKKPLSQKLFNQKKYIKILPTKKLISRNNDYIKKNTHKVMIRNKSNMEHSIKFQSNDNSILKNDDNLTNKTKNLLNYCSEIYTPKHSQDQSSNNIYNKSKNENSNLNLKQKNFINNARKNNIFLKKFFESESTKDKNDALKNSKSKIFSFPVSPKNKKNNNKIYLNNDLKSNDKMIKSFIQTKKHEIGFKNFSSNSSLNIFNNSKKDSKFDTKLNSYNNIKKDEINVNLISKIQKDNKNKNKTNFNVININNKNIDSYLKKIYYKNNKYFNQNNEKNNRNNNNYILINHLLLNDINITGNNNGNIIEKNLEKLKPKSSRNEKFKNNNDQKERIYLSNNDNNVNMNHVYYISLSETNINCEGLDIKKKIKFFKTKYNENISPEETHFKAVDFIQKVEISKYNIK